MTNQGHHKNSRKRQSQRWSPHPYPWVSCKTSERISADQCIVTWLLWCWDNGASTLELEGKEVKQLGSLSRARGINKVIGRQALSLWRQLLTGVKQRYSFKEDAGCQLGNGTIVDREVSSTWRSWLCWRQFTTIRMINSYLQTQHGARSQLLIKHMKTFRNLWKGEILNQSVLNSFWMSIFYCLAIEIHLLALTY